VLAHQVDDRIALLARGAQAAQQGIREPRRDFGVTVEGRVRALARAGLGLPRSWSSAAQRTRGIPAGAASHVMRLWT
jgi:hypothetical protein